MKRFLFAALAIFFALIFKSCASQKVAPEILNRQWMLVEFQNFTRDELVKNEAQMDLCASKSPQNQYRAKMGCNQMFFKADFKTKGAVKFSDLGSTMMYCEDGMKLENAFAKSLPTMKTFKIEGHRMTLSDGKGNTMKFIAADWD